VKRRFPKYRLACASLRPEMLLPPKIVNLIKSGRQRSEDGCAEDSVLEQITG
jgi:hypothetical protein